MKPLKWRIIVAKTIEAYRVGVEEPAVFRAWCGSGVWGHWHEHDSLGERPSCEGVVNLIEAKTPWNQSMRQRGPVRR
jgi:hypothetical protein